MFKFSKSKMTEQENNSYSSLKNKTRGIYSPNKTLFFFLLCTVCIYLLSGKSLNSETLKINNPYAKEIYDAITKPILDFSTKYKIDTIAPTLRKNFLAFSKLEENTNWDNFYYADVHENIFTRKDENDDTTKIDKLVDGKNDEAIKLAKNIEELETKIIILKDTLNELKTKTTNEKLIDEQSQNTTKINDAQKQSTVEQNSETNKTEEKKLYSYTKEKPLRVLMIGDSQMQSIAGGFKRLLGENSPIIVTDLSVPSSGFVRGDYYNWPKKLQNIFAQNKKTPFDISVIFLGMNDYQNFYNGNGKLLIKETKNWEEAYSEKIEKHLEILFANTKKVYWLGMPTARNKIYNAELSYIEKIQTKVSTNYAVAQLTKFSLRDIAPGNGVPYSDTVKTSTGEKIKLMREDGKHYTIAGCEYIMKDFLNLLYDDWNVEPIATNTK